MTNGRTNPFWDYSWAVYHECGVARACLDLQAREGLNVNILLFCCWAGRHGHSLTAAQLHLLRDAVAAWQREVVGPLRAVRRWLKTPEGLPDPPDPSDSEVLREAIKENELTAERLEQDILHRTLPLSQGSPDIEAMVGNLHGYFNIIGRTPGPEDTADLVAVMLAGLPRSVRALDLVQRLEESTGGGR
jgi:uncharacterized protein (TIGR02444 family)